MKLFMFFLTVFFFKLFAKFSSFINSDDCIGNLASKLIRIYTAYILRKILKEKRLFQVKRLTFAQAVIFDWQIWIFCTIISAFMYLFTLLIAYILNLFIRNEDVIEIITSIAAWIKNPFRWTSHQYPRYN